MRKKATAPMMAAPPTPTPTPTPIAVLLSPSEEGSWEGVGVEVGVCSKLDVAVLDGMALEEEVDCGTPMVEMMLASSVQRAQVG